MKEWNLDGRPDGKLRYQHDWPQGLFADGFAANTLARGHGEPVHKLVPWEKSRLTATSNQ